MGKVGDKDESSSPIEERVRPLPGKQAPVDVFLHVRSATVQAACDVIRLFTSPRGQRYAPIRLRQFFLQAGLIWLQNKVANQLPSSTRMTPWEEEILDKLDMCGGYISYNLTSRKHLLAGALAVKTLFAKHGCKSENAMRLTLSFLSVRFVDVVEEASGLLRSTLPTHYASNNIRYLALHRQFHGELLESVHAHVTAKVMEFFPRLQNTVEREFAAVCCFHQNSDSIVVFGTDHACQQAHTFLVRSLQELVWEDDGQGMDWARNLWPADRSRFTASAELSSIRVDCIRFTQCCVFDTFSAGASIMDLFEDILHERDNHRGCSKIRVVQDAGCYWSLDNRRLFVYKLCGLGEVLVRLLPPPNQEFHNKYRNGRPYHHITNGGRRVGVVQRNASVALPASEVIVQELSQITNVMSIDNQIIHEEKVSCMRGRHCRVPYGVPYDRPYGVPYAVRYEVDMAPCPHCDPSWEGWHCPMCGRHYVKSPAQ